MTIFKFLIKYSIFNLICLFTSNSSHLMGYIGKNVSVCVCVCMCALYMYIYIHSMYLAFILLQQIQGLCLNDA